MHFFLLYSMFVLGLMDDKDKAGSHLADYVSVMHTVPMIKLCLRSLLAGACCSSKNAPTSINADVIVYTMFTFALTSNR